VRIWHNGGSTRLELGLGPRDQLPPYIARESAGIDRGRRRRPGRRGSFGVRADGTLSAWGINGGNGRLGTTPPSFFEDRASSGLERAVPLAVRFDAVDVSSMNDHVLALTRDGRVACVGHR
jgi:hypothetical protein